jgi:hypothetical protein
MKKFLCLSGMVVLFLLISSTVNAAWIAMELAQPKFSNLKGWKIYYSVHVTDQAPTPAVSKDSYDKVTEWVGFIKEPYGIMPIVDREWGLTIETYPGYETYWLAELTFYLPGTLPEENKTVYFVAVATDFSGGESAASGVYPFVIEAPGHAAPPEVGYKTPGTLSLSKSPPNQISAPVGETLLIRSVRQVAF